MPVKRFECFGLALQQTTFILGGNVMIDNYLLFSLKKLCKD